MNKLVKTVFLVIMGVTVAMILYLVLFGTRSLNGDDLSNTKTGNIQQSEEWEGVLWYMGKAMETPIARYYYEYCFLPNIHQNDYVDEALGGKANPDMYDGTNIHKTQSNIGNDTSDPYVDLYNFINKTDGVTHYSSGWY